MIYKFLRSISFLLISIIILSIPAKAVRLAIPDGVFYYQPAGAVFGSEAIWVNPAGLGKYRAQSYQVMFDYLDGQFSKSWGTVSGSERFAIAYRKLYNPDGENYQEYIFGGGSELGQRIYTGVSYRYFKEGPGIYNNRHFWTISFMGNTKGKFNWGAVFSNLNRGRVNGERTETEQRYSLSYRPLKEKITLSVDMFLSTKTRLSNADYIYHVEFNPKAGIYVNGYINSDNDFEIGARVNLLKYFTGNKSSFNKNGDGRGTTVYIGNTSLKQPSVVSEPGRRLNLKISGTVSENPPHPYFSKKPISFTELTTNIYSAADDPSIEELMIKFKSPGFGFGQAQELREAFDYFKSRKKKLFCYLENPDNLSYYAASAADKIIVPPISQLNLVGLRAELSFYAGTLEKLGIKADLMRIGKYKSAAESFTNESSSEENKNQINRLLDDLFDQFVVGIAKGRNLSTDSVRTIIDNGPYTSYEALKYGLVEDTVYADELNDGFLQPMPEISFNKYLVDTLINDNWNSVPVIAVIAATGEIKDNHQSGMPFGGSSGISPSSMKSAFKQALKNPDVDAIVFRINSPGGFATAAEEIYHVADKISKKKPLIISMGNVAASGGYHIAMTGQKIFSNRATITGSIGIFGGKLDLSGLYEKIELNKELYTRGKYAGMLSSVRPFNDDERDKYFSHMKAFYDHFVKLISDNRKLPVDSIDQLGQGQVWTGNEALSNGLVDELGGINQAIEHAAKLIDADDYRIEIYPKRRTLFSFPGQRFINMAATLFSSDKSQSVGQVLGYSQAGSNEIFLTRMPFDILIE